MKILTLVLLIAFSTTSYAREKIQGEVDVENGKYLDLKESSIEPGETLKCIVIPSEMRESDDWSSAFTLTLYSDDKMSWQKLYITDYDGELGYEFVEYVDKVLVYESQTYEFDSNNPMSILALSLDKESNLTYYAGRLNPEAKKMVVVPREGTAVGLNYKIVASGIKSKYICQVVKI